MSESSQEANERERHYQQLEREHMMQLKWEDASRSLADFLADRQRSHEDRLREEGGFDIGLFG